MDNKLSFKEFLPLVLPLCNSEIRENVVERENYPIFKGDTLPYSVEYTLAQLIHKEILLHSNIERETLKLFNCYDYNVQAAFKVIDIRHTRYITFEILSKYLKKMKAEAQAEDITAFIRRIDRDLDCKVSFHEFSEIFQAPVTRRIKPSYITPTKSFQAGFSRSISLLGKKPLQKYKNSVIKHSNTSVKFATTKKSSKSNKKTLSTAKKPTFYQRQLSRSYSLFGGRPKKRPNSVLRRVKTPAKPKDQGQVYSSVKKVKLRKNAIFDFLRLQIRSEEQIELLKQNLILCKDLTIPKVWTLFDSKNKGYIQVIDLVKSLNSLGISKDDESAYLLFNRFDWDMDGVWKIDDIENLLVPAERDYKEMIASKIERNPNKKLRKETFDLLKRLLKAYIKAEIENEGYKKSIEEVNERRIFNEFDVNNVDSFTLAEVDLS